MTSETEGCDAAKSETSVATKYSSKGNILTRIKPYYKKFLDKVFGSKDNILTQSKPFQKLVDRVFAKCDTSKTGDVSKSELYAGLLTVHITLARYAGPAACFPPSREVSDQLFEAADADKSGGICKTEFQNILVFLCAQILSRMLAYYFVLILYVPWFSKKVIDTIESIPEGGFLESVAEQVISVSIFMVAVPLIWNFIDSKTETTIGEMNSSSTDGSEAKPETDKKDS